MSGPLLLTEEHFSLVCHRSVQEINVSGSNEAYKQILQIQLAFLSRRAQYDGGDVLLVLPVSASRSALCT